MGRTPHDDSRGYTVDKVLGDGTLAGTPVKFASAAEAHKRDQQLNGNRSGMTNGTGHDAVPPAKGKRS